MNLFPVALEPSKSCASSRDTRSREPIAPHVQTDSHTWWRSTATEFKAICKPKNPHCLLEAVLRSLKILFTFLVIRRTEFAFSVWFQIEERGRNMATMKVKCTRGSQLYIFELMEKGTTQPEDWRAGRATTSISQSSASTEP